jgi:hypothetical protein
MDAILAGITAWTIEISIAAFILWVMKIEERKVRKRRNNNK